MFDTWIGFSLLCPDLPAGEGLTLLGTPSSMISKNFSFNIKRCKDDDDEKVQNKEIKR